YAEVKRKAKTIRRVTQSGFMPPWPADPAYRHFVDEKYLSEEEKNLIAEWDEQGTPEGNSANKTELPTFTKGTALGEPDLVVAMKEEYLIKGNNLDNFLWIKLPFEIEQDTFIRAIEFVPGNRKLVHHMNGHLISYKEPEKKKIVSEGKHWVNSEFVSSQEKLFEEMKIPNDDGSYPTLTPLVSSYLPGMLPTVYPEGIGGYKIYQKGAFLLRDMHYGPTPVDATDLSYFNIYYDKGPPKRPTLELQMGTLGISDVVPPLVIPPDTVMTFHSTAVIKHDISLLTLNPHMHLLGKKFLAYAVTSSNDTIPLIKIDEWDFRWQYNYTFEKMLRIPAGSSIRVEGTFDNTVSNPNNPHNPPQEVKERDGSMRTTDEMFQFIFTFLEYKPGDEQIALKAKSIK
ncbi:MAG: hypothetical protein KJO64_01885, partial [Bacteroidia bacterium]|nr:hypothetical protein [Bacteroidia bacterium]